MARRLLCCLALTLAVSAQELHLSLPAGQQTLQQRVQAAAPPSAAAPTPAPQPQFQQQPQAIEVRFLLFNSGPALGASVRL